MADEDKELRFVELLKDDSNFDGGKDLDDHILADLRAYCRDYKNPRFAPANDGFVFYELSRSRFRVYFCMHCDHAVCFRNVHNNKSRAVKNHQCTDDGKGTKKRGRKKRGESSTAPTGRRAGTARTRARDAARAASEGKRGASSQSVVTASDSAGSEGGNNDGDDIDTRSVFAVEPEAKRQKVDYPASQRGSPPPTAPSSPYSATSSVASNYGDHAVVNRNRVNVTYVPSHYSAASSPEPSAFLSSTGNTELLSDVGSGIGFEPASGVGAYNVEMADFYAGTMLPEDPFLTSASHTLSPSPSSGGGAAFELGPVVTPSHSATSDDSAFYRGGDGGITSALAAAAAACTVLSTDHSAPLGTPQSLSDFPSTVAMAGAGTKRVSVVPTDSIPEAGAPVEVQLRQLSAVVVDMQTQIRDLQDQVAALSLARPQQSDGRSGSGAGGPASLAIDRQASMGGAFSADQYGMGLGDFAAQLNLWASATDTRGDLAYEHPINDEERDCIVPGMVINVVNGVVTLDTTRPSGFLSVVATEPWKTCKVRQHPDKEVCPVAVLGQVPVRVARTGLARHTKVPAGAYLFASGLGDGTAVWEAFDDESKRDRLVARVITGKVLRETPTWVEVNAWCVPALCNPDVGKSVKRAENIAQSALGVGSVGLGLAAHQAFSPESLLMADTRLAVVVGAATFLFGQFLAGDSQVVVGGRDVLDDPVMVL